MEGSPAPPGPQGHELGGGGGVLLFTSLTVTLDESLPVPGISSLSYKMKKLNQASDFKDRA